MKKNQGIGPRVNMDGSPVILKPITFNQCNPWMSRDPPKTTDQIWTWYGNDWADHTREANQRRIAAGELDDTEWNNP